MTMIPDGTEIANLLQSWLSTRLDLSALEWLEDRRKAITAGDRKALFLSFGLTSRKTGKADLQLSIAELSAATSIRPGWHPDHWSVDQVARILLLLQFPAKTEEEFVAVLEPLLAAAEVHELVALYHGLPLYPYPARLNFFAADGLRSNIPAVFKAIAHWNPYPSEQFNDDQWNQMVLKCLFIGASLDPIVGLDTRANPTLARMLTDFAQERRAAGRQVSPELWRCVGPFANGEIRKELELALNSGSELERRAAKLALESAPQPASTNAEGKLVRTDQRSLWSEIAVEFSRTP